MLFLGNIKNNSNWVHGFNASYKFVRENKSEHLGQTAEN